MADMSVEGVDPGAWVKRNPQMFFLGGRVDAVRLLAYVMNDVVGLGGGECRIVQRDGWWLVSSDVDWLVHELSVRELFERVVVAPNHGEHSMRAEVLVHAYAADVFAVSGGDECEIKGLAPDRQLLDSVTHGGGALLAFRLEA